MIDTGKQISHQEITTIEVKKVNGVVKCPFSILLIIINVKSDMIERIAIANIFYFLFLY